MKAKELKEKNDKDLKKLLEEKRVQVRDFRFGVAGSQARDTKEGRNNKKVIARILTELHTRSTEKENVATK